MGMANCMAQEFAVLDDTHLQSAFELATEVFVRGSTLHKALGIGLEEYRTYLRHSFEEMVLEGISIVAIDDDCGEVVGCMIATDFYKCINLSSDGHAKFEPLAHLSNALCGQFLQSRSIGPGETVLVDMGAVSPKFEGKGIYKEMRKLVHQTARHAGFRQILGELSSSSTQHVILGKLGHRKVAEIAFADFEHEGKFPFSSITEPQSIILAECDL